MHVLGAIFLTGQPFWRGEAGRAIVQRFLIFLDEIAGGEAVRVVTDSREVAELVASRGGQAIHDPVDGVPEDICPEQDLRRALRAFLRRGEDPARPVMVVNVHTPLAWPHAKRLATSGKSAAQDLAAISVAEARDHPCQYNQYATVLDTGLAAFFDPADGTAASAASGPDARRYTFPFAFEWGRWGLADSRARDFLLKDAFVPADADRADMVWRFEAPCLARLGLPRSGIVGDAIGAAFGARSRPSLTGRTGPGGRESARLTWAGTDWAGHVLAAAFFTAKGQGPTVYAPVVPDGAGSGSAAELGVPEGSLGFRYLVLAVAEDESYEIALPVLIEGLGYHARFLDNEFVRFNDLNGERIHGRQNFPPLHEVDGSFALIPGPLVQAFAAGLVEEFLPVVLSEDARLAIRDAVDHALYEIMQGKGGGHAC